MENEILTIEEVCDILRLGKSKVYNMLRSRELVAMKLGRKWLVTREGLKAFIKNKNGVSV